MSSQTSRYSAEETAQRGDKIYEQEIHSRVEDNNRGKVVAVDAESSAYPVAEDALSASRDLLDRLPEAEIWCVRAGSRALYRMGGVPARAKFEQALAKVSDAPPEKYDRL